MSSSAVGSTRLSALAIVFASWAFFAMLACRAKPAAEHYNAPQPEAGAAAAAETAPEQVAPPPTAPSEAPVAAARSEQSGGGRRGDGASGDASEEAKPPGKNDEAKDRPGIPVTDALVRAKCTVCHNPHEGGKLSRISYMRKTPEAWELSLKRMVRLHQLQITPDEARAVVRYLSDNHGLTRSEAESAMHEVERRVHWSDAKEDKELRESCGECHTLGRVASERRDAEEWKHLKATHMAFFPLARGQAFRGDGDGDSGMSVDFASMTEAEIDEWREQRRRNPGKDQADRVLERLAKQGPLFTPEWSSVQANWRPAPMEGLWIVSGHDVGRGDLRGTLEVAAQEGGGYTTRWRLSYQDGASVERTGKAVFYAGHSWRGRSQVSSGTQPAELREVLLLSEDWQSMRGRLFAGEYNELGIDVQLERAASAPRVDCAPNAALLVPGAGQTLDVLARGLSTVPAAAEFSLGQGVSVSAVERVDGERLRLTVDIAPGARQGTRVLTFGVQRAPTQVVVHDTIDYIKITPEKGLARVGGKMRPPQFERFEALGMNRGADGELYTADDFFVKFVPARWSLEEFPVREDDDDVRFVGAIDAESGAFTPGLDGPNPARKWSTNNVGEVYIRARVTLSTPQIPAPPKKDKKSKPDTALPTPPAGPFEMVEKEFTARAPLLVMVPIYVDWDRYVWDQR